MKTIECKICNKILSTKYTMKSHIKNCHKLTEIEYANRYFKCINDLNINFNIDYESEILTYSKVQKDTRTYNCPICDKKLTAKTPYIESHIKRIHKIFNKVEFYEKYYTLENKDEFDEFIKKGDMCGLCNVRKINIRNLFSFDHENMIYKIDVNKGYSCDTLECKHETSLKIFGNEYNKKQYEHIGAKTDYLNLKYKLNGDKIALKKLKWASHDYTKPVTVSLKDYILRDGEEIGTIKYNERNDKICVAQSEKWYIDKFGEELGKIKWRHRCESGKSDLDGFIKRYGKKIGIIKYNERIEKIVLSNSKQWYIDKFGDTEGILRWNKKNSSVSQLSKDFGIFLNECGLDFQDEVWFKTDKCRGAVDFYIESHNLYIEFYGDYWHANPSKYQADYFNKTIKMTAKEIWNKNKFRLNELLNYKDSNILVVWEDTWNTDKLKITNVLEKYNICIKFGLKTNF